MTEIFKIIIHALISIQYDFQKQMYLIIANVQTSEHLSFFARQI